MSVLIDAPGKIICVGLNYADHLGEAKADRPPAPVLFAKWNNTLIGPGDQIVIPPGVEQVDYEGELGVVIGRRAHRVKESQGLDYVGGYCCANDVSARALQLSQPQWCLGKSVDTFCPVGELTAAAEVADPQALDLRTVVNGVVVQEASTASMIFGVAELIAFISRVITLEANDLILTGTPAGIGAGRTPPLYLQPGDEVAVEISGLASLENTVVAERAAG